MQSEAVDNAEAAVEVAEELDQHAEETAKVDKKSGSSATEVTLLTKVVIWTMRIVVGVVFVVSGFVKAIDPWGSIYKFSEYIQALGWDSLLSLTTFGSFALPALEFVLGVMLLVGAYRRMAPLLSVLFMLFMTPLTLWLAITDAVPECGCFGDFIVTSNWVTFFKNVMLLAGAVYLLIYNKRVKSLYGPAVQWIVMMLSFAFSIAVSFGGYFTQPFIDFRPYKVGTQLESKATSVDDNEYVFIYKKDGQEKEFAINDVPDEDSGWEYVDRRVVEKDAPATNQNGMSLGMWESGDDLSDEVLANEQLLLLLIPDMEQVSIAYTFVINELQDYSEQHGVAFVGLTGSTEEEIAEWVDLSMAHYPIYTSDDSEIKMMARGNPAVVYVRDKKIVWKRTLASLNPDVMFSGEKLVSQFNDDFKPAEELRRLILMYLALMLVVLIVNRTHLLFRITHKKKDVDENKQDKPLASDDKDETK